MVGRIKVFLLAECLGEGLIRHKFGKIFPELGVPYGPFAGLFPRQDAPRFVQESRPVCSPGPRFVQLSANS
jgi:hypothetical protein